MPASCHTQPHAINSRYADAVERQYHHVLARRRYGLGVLQSTITGATYIINAQKISCRNGQALKLYCGSSMRSAVCADIAKRRYAHIDRTPWLCESNGRPDEKEFYVTSCKRLPSARLHSGVNLPCFFCGGSLTDDGRRSMPGADAARPGATRLNIQRHAEAARRCWRSYLGTIRRGAARLLSGAGLSSTGLSAGIIAGL